MRHYRGPVCDHCNAKPVTKREGAVVLTTVYHDDWCPFLRAIEGRN
jgi:hypothetical protein